MRESRLLVSALAALVAGYWLLRFVFPEEELLKDTGDLRTYFYPLYELTYGRMGSGELPLWNPYHMTGYPQLATHQGGFFYPPHLLYLVLPTHLALALSGVLHLVWIATSSAWFARRLGVGSLAALLVGLLFTLRGPVQWWLLWPAMLESAAWLPLGCIAVWDLARGDGWRGGCLLALAAAMTLLAGHAQVAGYLAWAWTSLLLALLAGARRDARHWLGAGVRFAGGLALGALLAGVQLAPVVELSLDGTRQLGALAASQVLAMGSGGFRSVSEAVVGSQFSFGVVALALAPVAVFHSLRRAVVVWALALVVATWALASVSSESGVAIYQSIPGIGWFRSPRRILFLTHFGVALLAGLGLDVLLARRGGTAPLLASATALVLAGFVAASGSNATALIGLAVAAAVAAGGWLQHERAVSVAAAVLLGVAGAELLLGSSIRGRLPYDQAAAAVYRENAPAYRELAERLGTGRAVWLPLPRSRDLKLAGLWGLRRVDDFEPLNLRRQSEYFDYFQYGRTYVPDAKRFFSGDVIPERRWPGERLRTWSRDMAGRRRLLDLAATRLFVTPDWLGPVQQSAVREFATSAGLADDAGVAGFHVRRNPHALPRAYVTYRTLRAPEVDVLLRELSREDFDPLALSYVEEAAGFEAASGAPARGEPAAIVVDRDTLVEVTAELAAPGLVVLADAYYPGWRAFVDGTPSPVVATNHLFRGVAVSAGRHVIQFEYRPASLPIGLGASATGAALFSFALWRGRAK